MTELAIAKLKQEAKNAKYDKYAQIMKERTCETLMDFCRQDAEFAQAVYQGGSFEDCMKEVAKNCGNGISDLEAFRRAVRFYFKGADIQFHMTINLCADVEKAAQTQEKEQSGANKIVSLDLGSFLL